MRRAMVGRSSATGSSLRRYPDRAASAQAACAPAARGGDASRWRRVPDRRTSACRRATAFRARRLAVARWVSSWCLSRRRCDAQLRLQLANFASRYVHPVASAWHLAKLRLQATTSPGIARGGCYGGASQADPAGFAARISAFSRSRMLLHRIRRALAAGWSLRVARQQFVHADPSSSRRSARVAEHGTPRPRYRPDRIPEQFAPGNVIRASPRRGRAHRHRWPGITFSASVLDLEHQVGEAGMGVQRTEHGVARHPGDRLMAMVDSGSSFRWRALNAAGSRTCASGHRKA